MTHLQNRLFGKLDTSKASPEPFGQYAQADLGRLPLANYFQGHGPTGSAHLEASRSVKDRVGHVLDALQISEDIKAKIYTESRIERVPSGAHLIKSSEEIFRWHLVLDGIVGQFQKLPGVPSMPILLHGRRRWLAQEDICNDGFSRFNYVALTDAQVLSFPAAYLRQMCAQDLDFAMQVIRTTVRQLHECMDLLCLMKYGNVPVRIVAGLALIASSLQDATGLDRQEDRKLNEGKAFFPVPQRVISQLCGVSKSHFSSTIQHLSRQGWLSAHYGGLELFYLPIWLRLARQLRMPGAIDMSATIDELNALLRSLGEAPNGKPHLASERTGPASARSGPASRL